MSTEHTFFGRVRRAVSYRLRMLKLFCTQLLRIVPPGGAYRFPRRYWTPRFWTGQNSKRAENQKQAQLARQAALGIVEIGVLFGETSKILAESNPDVPVYGIDPIIVDSMSDTLIGNLDTIKKNTEGLSNFTLIKDYSFNVVRSWDKAIDYVYIDGSHVYEEVKQDFEDWYPKLAPGGIIAFHDSTMYRGGMPYWAGPSRLCDELIFDSRLKFVESFARLSIFQKPEHQGA